MAAFVTFFTYFVKEFETVITIACFKQRWQICPLALFVCYIENDIASANQMLYERPMTITVQSKSILAWKTPLWGPPLAPVNSFYRLFSEVRLSQMVLFQSHGSRTVTCIAVKDQETVNYTEWHKDARTDLLSLDTSLLMSPCFSLKTSLSINLTDKSTCVCACSVCVRVVCVCMHVFASVQTH